jgi:hypothetical protein
MGAPCLEQQSRGLAARPLPRFERPTMALSRLHHIVRRLLEGRLDNSSIELLDEFVEIVRLYESGDDSVRASIRAAIDVSESSALLSLSSACVAAAVPRRRTDLIDI